MKILTSKDYSAPNIFKRGNKYQSSKISHAFGRAPCRHNRHASSHQSHVNASNLRELPVRAAAALRTRRSQGGGGVRMPVEAEERSSDGHSSEWPATFECHLLPHACGRRAVSANRAAVAGIDGAATTAGRSSVLDLEAPLRVDLARRQGDRPPGTSVIFLSFPPWADRPEQRQRRLDSRRRPSPPRLPRLLLPLRRAVSACPPAPTVTPG
ncbi:unnamed protein product [Urochloa humidicola]